MTNTEETLLVLAGMACVLHCHVRVLRWYRVSDVYAIGVYGPVSEALPGKFMDLKSERCEDLFKSGFRDVERDLQWRTGMVGRLFPPFYDRAQVVLIIAAFILIWLSAASRWFLLLPVTAWMGSWSYFHMQGWKWLRAGCERYQAKGMNKKTT